MNRRLEAPWGRGVTAVVSLILAFIVVWAPSHANEIDRFTREAVVGDALIGIVSEGGREARVAHGIVDRVVFVDDEEVSLSEALRSLTVLERSTVSSGSAGTALPWEEAEPLLARVLASHDDLGPVLPGTRMHIVDTDGGLMFMPRGLVASARLATGGALDVVLKKRRARRALFAEAALRAVALDESRRVDETLTERLAAWRSGAIALLGVSDAAASQGVDAYTQLRTISSTYKAAQHGGATAKVASKVHSRVARSGLGKSTKALGVLAVGVELARGFADEQARNRLLAEAAGDALVVLGLENARRLLVASRADPAMVEGLEDALGQLTEMSRSRLARYKKTGTGALVGSVPMLGSMVVVGLASSPGAGIVAREVWALGEELVDYGKAVLVMSALETMGGSLAGATEELIAGGGVGGTTADAYAVRELVGLHNRLSAEAAASLYSMLWGDRWAGMSSLAGIGKAAGLTLAELFTGDAGQKEVFEREVKRRIKRVRDNAAFAAALPRILRELRAVYAYPDNPEAREQVQRPDDAVTRFRDCADCPEMVLVSSGSYLMGSPASEKGRRGDEGPVRRVKISKPFAVGVYEVTRREWRRFVEETAHAIDDGCSTNEDGRWRKRSGRSWRRPGYVQGDDHPVVCVSWKDAQAYVRWLRERTGRGYRLPSESEWEYVARAGTRTARYWGESAAGRCRYGNGADIASCDDGYAYTSPAGSFIANGYGLHDVLGNVWEWVEDCWNSSYRGAPGNGSAWESGDCGKRVLRGGRWDDAPKNLRSATRVGRSAGYRSFSVGFRIALTW